MDLAVLTSNQLRHKWLAHQLVKNGHRIKLIVSEKRTIPESGGDEESALVAEHFKSFTQAEERFFTGFEYFPENAEETITTYAGGLNDAEVQEKIVNSKVDYIVVFGSSIIREPLLSAYSGQMLNLHQGLSPYYRGSGTNFWPFYNEEIEYVGVTLHYIDKGIDTGAMIAHSRPDIKVGDDQYSIGCRTIESSVELLLQALSLLENGHVLKTTTQWQKGKLYQRNDFSAESVRKVHNLVDEGMIDDYCKRNVKGLNKKIKLLDLEVA